MSEQLSFELLDAPIVATVVDDTPPDSAARERITADLASNLFVEAGAGAGKTTQLVGRVLALVRAGIPITSIAAITFTEKAAADLRHRLRNDLTAAEASEVADTADTRDLIVAALDDLDHAPIGTLHAFARRLLYEFPIEAGLPPGFTVRDELESDLAFRERWDDLLDRLLEDPDPPAGAIDGGSEFVQLCEFDRFGVRRGVRRVAEDFQANWDLVADRVELSPPPRFVLDTEPIRLAVEMLCTHDAPEDDKQFEALTEIAEMARCARARQLDPHPPRCGRAHRSAMPQGRARREQDQVETARRGGRPRRAPHGGARCRCGRRPADPRRRGLPPAAPGIARRNVRARRCRRSCVGRHARVPRPLGVRQASARDPTRCPIRAPPRATNGSFSTSSRTPTRSSSRSRCASPRSRMIRRTRPTGDSSGPARNGCSSSVTRSSRSTVSGAPTSPSISAPPSRPVPRPCC